MSTVAAGHHPVQLALVKRLRAQLEGARAGGARAGEVPADCYTSPEHFGRERALVFRRLPALVALEQELEAPGACLTAEVAGVPLVVVRGDDGEIRAFLNACRHRATALLAADEAPCRRKAFVCPYHGWTYDLAGRLLHVPHAASFSGRDAARSHLVRAHVAVRHGLVFAGLLPFDPEALFGPIDGDLASLQAGSLTLYRRSDREVRGNWKLVVDAFLDGYHIRHLHRDSIYRFFLDARAEAEPAGLHIRAVTGRRALAAVAPDALADHDLRQLATPSYLVFPSVVLILHPDYLSVLAVTPLAPDRCRVVHRMLVAGASRSEAEEAHFARSFALIDGGVFEREDFAAVEAMQRGLETGANETVLFGELEHAALWFHETLARLLGTEPGTVAAPML